ncbi:hypothetical protein BVRB_4g094250 [Beta vulgaris subsp. vulgaris]|nr:hypothetical protein BVRB_4g094250 [Beta vulgaris subsp. vulgaris]
MDNPHILLNETMESQWNEPTLQRIMSLESQAIADC